jgi:hypothetical protein
MKINIIIVTLLNLFIYWTFFKLLLIYNHREKITLEGYLKSIEKNVVIINIVAV